MTTTAMVSVVLGGLLWLLWSATLAPGVPQGLLLLGALVVVPLGLLADGGASSPQRVGATRLALPAALGLLASQHLSPGVVAGLLSLPWLAVTALLGLHGVWRLGPRLRHPWAALCVDAAYLFVVVGGGWSLLDRLGIRPLGYDPLIVLLTAVHFHFAGFALPLLAGLLGRSRPGGLPWPVAGGILAGIPLVAGGLVLSQVTGWTGGEWLASWTLALAGGSLGLLQLWEGRRRWRSGGGRGPSLLLMLSGASLLGGMFMAAAYGLGRAWGHRWPGMVDMFWLHGVLNAVGFSMLGLLARALDRPQPPGEAPPTPPLPHRGLYGRGLRIGTGWFARNNLSDPLLPAPTGQLDRLSDLAWGGFQPERVDPSVRAFYEETGRHTLWVRARWRPWAAPLGRLSAALGRRMGQLVLPQNDGGTWHAIRAQVFAHRQPTDPLLPDTRLYERTYAATGAPMFIAAYASTPSSAPTPTPMPGLTRPFLCVSLPLPGASLLCILRLEDLPEGGLRIRSRPLDAWGSEGIFLDTPFATLRLPLHEDLLLGPLHAGFAPGPDPAVPQATLGALHRFHLLGRPLLELDYLIHPS